MYATAEAFDRVCKALFGETYESVAAKHLEVRRDTVRHWSTGRRGVPPEVWPKLRGKALTIARDVDHAIQAIDEEIGKVGHG